MRLYVAATGSAANTYVLSAEDGSSLILDAGAPLKTVLPHIPDLRKVRGCLVTHEHADHARHMEDYRLRGIRPIASLGTLQALGSDAEPVSAMQRLTLGDFAVLPFDVQHDAAQPLGFLVQYIPTRETLVYATDTYYLKFTFPGVHYWLMECNYCEDLIKQDEMHEYHIRRLNESHMNLRRLKDALRANDLTEAVKIVLVHLSDRRSDEARMVRDITELTGVDTVAADAGMTIDLNLIPF